MFWHVFRYKIICMLRDRLTLFWTFLFPILLSVLFNLAFGNLSAEEAFRKLPVAVVGGGDVAGLRTVMDETELFTVTEATAAQAEELLARGEVTGVLTAGDPLVLTLSGEGIDQTILSSFLDAYEQTRATLGRIARENPQALADGVLQALDTDRYIESIPPGNGADVSVVLFYTLLAMTCLLGGTLSCADVANVQANQSARAARQAASPAHKMKLYLGMALATLVFHFASVLLVFLFISQVLGVSFGAHFGYILLLCFISCFTGVTLGSMVGALTKRSENVKVAFLVAFTLVCCFFAGMMSPDIKYLVQYYAPVMSYLNPANLMSDGFYALYFYTTFDRYFVNLSLLAGFGVVFGLVTYLVLRRQRYASV